MWEIEGLPHWLGLAINGAIGFVFVTAIFAGIIVCLWFWGIVVYLVYESFSDALSEWRWTRDTEKERERGKDHGWD